MGMKSDTITLNGVVYDRETGEAVGKAPQTQSTQPKTASQPHRQSSHAAHDIHARTQRSTTLNRQYAKKQASHAVQPKPTVAVDQKKSQRDAPKVAVQRPDSIRRFAKHPVDITAPRRPQQQSSDRPASVHPMVQRVHEKRAEHAPVAHKTAKPSDVIKKEAIDSAMNGVSSNSHKRVRAKKAPKKSFGRLASLASAGSALLLIAGYFTYLNMPNLSVRVAAAQAGIDAEYPSYRPSGYSLNGPVAYDQGQVSMTFASNGGPQEFKLIQSKTGWDSSAVLDNYVQPQAGEEYVTSRNSGLTIYTFDNNAAWVSNGILYTVEGDASLSIDQVQRMATSL